MAVKYAILFDVIAGRSTIPRYEDWTEIDIITSTVSAEAQLVGSEMSQAPAVFDAFQVEFRDATMLTALAVAQAEGATIPAVRIVALREPTEAEPYAVTQEIRLNDVRLEDLSFGQSPGPRATLRFEQIGRADYDVSDPRVPSLIQDFGYDLATRTTVAFESLDQATETGNGNRYGPGGEAEAVYVRIEGLRGDVVEVGYEGWFRATDLQVRIPGREDPQDTQTQIQPVKLTLQGMVGEAQILDALSQGGAIPLVEIAGMYGDGQGGHVSLFEVTLEEARLASVGSTKSAGPDPSATGLSLELDYQRIGVSVDADRGDGGWDREFTPFGWDVGLWEAADVSDPGGTAKPLQETQATEFVMWIEGISGPVSLDGRDGGFALNTVSTSWESLPDGRIVPGDVTVSIAGNDADLNRLLVLQAQIPAVMIRSYSPDDAGRQSLVTEMRLNGVALTGLRETELAETEQPTVELTMDFTSFGLRQTATETDGRDALLEMGYDAATGTAVDPDTLALPGESASTDPEIQSADLIYAIRIDGMAGRSEIPGYEDWTEIESVSTEMSVASELVGSQLMLGVPAFDGLEVQFKDATLLAALASARANDTVIPAVEIVGLFSPGPGGGISKVKEFRLNSVWLEDVSFGRSVGPAATLRFEEIGRAEYLITGSTVTRVQDFGYDIGIQGAVAFDALAATTTATDGQYTGLANEAEALYVRIEGLKGDVAVPGFEGWFRAAGLEASLPGLLEPQVGQTTSEPVSLVLLGMAGDAQIQKLLTESRKVPSLEIAGVYGDGRGGVVARYEVTLHEARLEGVVSSHSPSEGAMLELDLGYDRIGFSIDGENRSGWREDFARFGWDVEEWRAAEVAADGASGSVVPLDPLVATDYVMWIDGIEGPETQDGLGGGFRLERMSSTWQTLPSGQPVPLDFQVSLSEPDAGLNAILLGGEIIPAVVIRGYGLDRAGREVALTEVRLNGVAFSRIEEWRGEDGASRPVELTLEFERVGLIQKASDINDDVVDFEAGFDVATNLPIEPGALDLPGEGFGTLGPLRDADSGPDAIFEAVAPGTYTGITASSENATAYALDSDDGGLLRIDPGDGRVYADGFVDYETLGGSINFTVRATEGDASRSATFSLAIRDVSEVLEGTEGNDVLRGSRDRDTINGYGGNDSLYGADRDDVLNGGPGADVLRGDAGADTLNGGAGADRLYSGTGPSGLMAGGAGNDTYYVDAASVTFEEAAGGGTDVVWTSVDADLGAAHIEELRAADARAETPLRLIGSPQDNILRGNAGANHLDGEGGVDRMYGMRGNDRYAVDDPGDRIFEAAGEGDDIVFASTDFRLQEGQEIERLSAQSADLGYGLTLQGNSLDNTITGSVASDWLLGHQGDDRLVPVAGDDTVDGGDGTDTVVIGLSSEDATGIAGASALVLESDLGAMSISDTVEFFEFTDRTLSYAEATALRARGPAGQGTNAADLLAGTSGDDSLDARAGDDWITPGTGNDTIDGGAGRDMLSFVDLPDDPDRTPTEYRIDLDLEAGTATGGGDSYTITGIERVSGSVFADRIKGDDNANELRGLGDYDWFIATPGGDTIDGGTGQDMLSFVEWQSDAPNTGDAFNPGGMPPQADLVTGVVVNLNDPSQNTNLAAGHDLTSVERITGSGRQDVFWGDDQSNDFRGLGDYDWFVASDGGRERYFGGDGIDTVTYFNAPTRVIASLRNGAEVNGLETGRGTDGWAALDLYFEIEGLVGSAHDDRLAGNSLRNTLSGLDGNDLLEGYDGIDTLKGGAGRDTIDGGAGSDYALFDGASTDYLIDRIQDRRVHVTDAAGDTDVLLDVEYMRFEDVEIALWDLTL